MKHINRLVEGATIVAIVGIAAVLLSVMMTLGETSGALVRVALLLTSVYGIGYLATYERKD